MAFSGKIQYCIRTIGLQQPTHQFGIADIALNENVVLILCQFRQILRIAGIGQLVQIDDAFTPLPGLEDITGTNKTGAAGDEDSLAHGTSNAHRCAGYCCRGERASSAIVRERASCQ